MAQRKKQQKKGVSFVPCLFLKHVLWTWHVSWLHSGSNARNWHSLTAVVNFKCNKITLQYLTHLWEQHHDTVDTECSLMASAAKLKCKMSGITTAAFKKKKTSFRGAFKILSGVTGVVDLQMWRTSSFRCLLTSFSVPAKYGSVPRGRETRRCSIPARRQTWKRLSCGALLD